jgi:arylsulfatase A-like enzyme
MAARRNVLFVVIDQLRADCLWGRLAQAVDLPNLRALAKDGVSFRRHYSVVNPCGPSRASLLTGQYAMNHRAVRNGTPLPHDKPNLATEARKAGYLPLLFGYTDSAPDPRVHDPADPVLRSYEQVMPGFVETVEMRLEESWPWRAHLAAKGYDVPPYPQIFRPRGDRIDDPAFYAAEDSDTAFLTDRVISELRARPRGWFAHVTFIRPHPPLVAPEPYNRMYDPANVPPPVAGDLDHPFASAARAYYRADQTVVGFPQLPDTPETVATLRSIYLGLATEVDHQIGRLVAFLRDEGLYDDTLIVVTADHGEMLGDHGCWGKSTHFDAAFHTPLIIRDPAHARDFGREVSAFTESVDIAPTILDLIGRRAPDTMDGRSLTPFLRGETPADWRAASHSELDFGDPVEPTIFQEMLGLPSRDCHLAIRRTDRHTLVHFGGGLPQILYDHGAVGEARDVASSEGAQGILLEMTRQLLSHRMQHAEGRFARTMVTSEGAREGDY